MGVSSFSESPLHSLSEWGSISVAPSDTSSTGSVDQSTSRDHRRGRAIRTRRSCTSPLYENACEIEMVAPTGTPGAAVDLCSVPFEVIVLHQRHSGRD